MPHDTQGFIKLLRVSEMLYALLLGFSCYLLFISRTGEAHTIWEALHPAFIPTLFVATSLLLAIQFTSEKVAYKLLFIIAHSVLVHSFFSVIFPAGDLSGQQIYLGRIRLVYDNAVLHGWPSWSVETVQSQIFRRFGGINFQAAVSVIFARMLSVDIFWVHLALVPILWGIFTPIAAYLTTYTLSQNEKVSVLSSLFLSVFPYVTYFGAISVPNSLGYIFFFYSLYFILRNLNSNDSETKFLMLVFSFFALLSHYLTGVISFSLLFLSLVFKSYRGEKSQAISAKVSLVIAFLFCASLLPLSLIYLRFFRPSTTTAFTLERFNELPIEETIGLALLGDLTYSFHLETILLFVSGPTLAFAYNIYLLYKTKKNPNAKFRTYTPFLFAAFLMMLIDYRILKLFMEGLPFNEERLWVFRDFVAVPFVALAVYGAISSINVFLKTHYPPTISPADLKALSRRNALHVLTLLLALTVLIPMALGGWITYSLRAAYPRIAPLQTTWYELEAVKHIEENTEEKYVVIGDVWTIFVGEMIVGINNPSAYYFGEYNKTGYDLFYNMTQDPSPQWMLQAMNYTDTTTAYFIVTEPRLGTEEYNRIVTEARTRLPVYGVFGEGKLHIFYYKK